MLFEFGSAVHCSDGPFGELADVVIDPIRRRVRYLVVEPRHRHGLARLVPVEVVADEPDRLRRAIPLRCTAEQVRTLAPVQAFTFLRLNEIPAADPDWDVGVEDVFAVPYFGAATFDPIPVVNDPEVGISYDRIPKGEVEIRRASAVVSADHHHVGHVDGFLVDADEQITHVVLERGHLWGRREVTIPIAAVARVETDSVTLAMTKEAVAALPQIGVRRWQRSAADAISEAPA